MLCKKSLVTVCVKRKRESHPSIMTLQAGRARNRDDGDLVAPRNVHDSDDVLRARGPYDDGVGKGRKVGILRGSIYLQVLWIELYAVWARQCVSQLGYGRQDLFFGRVSCSRQIRVVKKWLWMV